MAASSDEPQEQPESRHSSFVVTRSELSLEGIFSKHASYVWRLLGRLGIPPRDVPDVCQEVFITVHRKLPEFEGRSSVKTWLFSICYRLAQSYRRSYRARELPTDELAFTAQDGGLAMSESSPEVQVDKQRAKAMLDHALNLLDDEKRVVFVLYELEELSMPEVAEAVGCPVSTAYSRLHAARKSIRAAFARATLVETGSVR
ncbi:MAG: sigma-70 family RNA polymerase sigma factor [Polyangiaceae bacterium]